MNHIVHPFESAGLGLAPFRFVGSCEKTYQACHGAPIQPGGSCDYCGNGIVVCCSIKSADGKVFTVGSTCVEKTSDRSIVDPMKRALAIAKRDAKKVADAARIARAIEILDTRDDVIEALRAASHPEIPGATLLSYVGWLLRHAGNAGKVRAARYVEAAQV